MSAITLLLLSNDRLGTRSLREVLVSQGYSVSEANDLEELNKALLNSNWLAVVMDIDSVPLNNETIRKLAIQHPQSPLLCISKDRFHPELKDAICYYIYACLKKPLDPDELIYWLRCIEKNEHDSRRLLE